MTGVPVSPRRVFGVVLAAGPAAGDATWVCRGHPGEAGIRLESVETLARLPGGASEPEAAYRALVGKILDAPRSAWGLDFAFGVPVADVDAEARSSGRARAGWKEALRRAAARAQPVAPGAPDRRQTDEDRGLSGPLSPERRERTLAGMGEVLARLHGQGAVAVLPLDPLPALPEGTPPAMVARAPSTYLLEVAPGCTLADLRRVDPTVVDKSGAIPGDPDAREQVVRGLVRAEWLRPVPRALRRQAAAEEGSLAAVLAAVGAWRGYRGGDHGSLHHHPRYGIEGHVYC